MRAKYLIAACLLFAQSAHAQKTTLSDAARKYLQVATRLDPDAGIPRATTAQSSLGRQSSVVRSSDTWTQTPVNDWTSGFFPGTLWYLYAYTHNPALKAQATRWTLPLARISEGTFSHDLGFQFNSSFANAYRITAEERFRIPVMTAARLLANRFNPTVGAIKSWDWMDAAHPFPVIADNMMNLELLFWAARQKNGDPHWRDIAVQHARTTLANHVRADGSSYHVVVFNPNTGAVMQRMTHQGYADSSTWARGQAWLIYGFTMTFRETGERTFLDAARKLADYYLAHLNSDGVPCWDFQAPDCPELRDASAAAIAASGLLELSTYVESPVSQTYRNAAETALRTLSSRAYNAGQRSDALLMHAVGNKPANSEVDVGITYADYYFVEALLREKQLNGDTALHVMPARLPLTYTWRSDLLRKSKERIGRGDKELKPALAKLIHDADSALHVGPFTVTAKKLTPPSGDKHDYVSYGPYWWPDTTKPNGLPYIRRDGEVNPVTRNDSDVLRWYALTDAVQTLAQAYYFTDKPAYAERAAVLLRTWFIDPATRMNPNQNFGQAIPGVVEGRGIGLIDLRDWGVVLDAVSLLETSPAWKAADDSALRAWTSQYLSWLKTSKNGTDESKELNNHGTWYDVQLGALQLFSGDSADARALFEQAKTKRIASEIDSIGRQPLELARTRSLHYSVENLEGMTRLAEMARNVGVDLWHWRAPNGASIKAAIDYVAPYADTTKVWPNQQITKEPDDLFVPLLLRSRIALGDAKYLEYAEHIAPNIISGHRAWLLYPQPHPSAPCNADCLIESQWIQNGRRTVWANASRLDAIGGAETLRELMKQPAPSARVQAAINGGIAWLREVALYGSPNSPVWAHYYAIDTNAPLKSDSLSTSPKAALADYDRWLARIHNPLAKQSYHVVVDASFKGHSAHTFATIHDALAHAPADAQPYEIKIRNGSYNERISVERPNVRFVGANKDSTILSYDVAAGYRSATGGTYGTRGAFVLRIAAPGFRLSSMTVANTFDYPSNYAKTNADSTKLRDSQGVAVMLDNGSDKAVFENCTISGHQDTLFPNAGRSYFHKCTISGSVDFIFGAGRAVFNDVDIISRDRGSKSNNGYITAASTPLSQPYGFLIINSRLKKESPAMAAGTVALGRPWHPASDPNAVASVVYINDWMDDHISTRGWETMNATDAAGVRTTYDPRDARVAEYGSKGPGALKSTSRRTLTDTEARNFTIAKVLDGWIPE